MPNAWAPVIWLVLGAGCGIARGGEPTTLQPARTIALPGVAGRIDHLAHDAAGRRLFVAALGNDTVEVVDLNAGKPTRRLSHLPTPTGIAWLPRRKRLVVASAGDGACRCYDTGLKLQTTIPDLPDADNVRVDAAEGRVYVGYGDGALGVIDVRDPAAARCVARIPLPGHPEAFALEHDGPRIFVNVPRVRAVAVVDRKTARVVATWKLDGARSNFPMALDEARHRLWIGCRRPATVLALDTTTGAVAARVPCTSDADDLFTDSARHRLYASGGGGTCSVFALGGAGAPRLLEQVETAAGARTSLFVPATNRLFVAAPARNGRTATIREFTVLPTRPSPGGK